ncbi:MAG: hypothetical protein V5783_12705 [Pontiella sp.]
MSLFRKCTTLSLLFALPLSALALQRTDLLPPQGRSYVRISNTENFIADLQKSSLGKLWADPQFQDFIGNPDQEIWNSFFFEGASKEEDELFVEQMKLLTGEVVLAFDIENENIYIIADMSEEDFQHSLKLDEKLQHITEDPFDLMKSSFQGVEMIQHIDNPGSGLEISSWQAHVDQTFVFGYTREWVEQCIIRLKNNAIEEPTGYPAVTVNLPVKALMLESFEAEDHALFEALGLLGIENFSCNIELRDSEIIVDNHLIIEDLRRGLFSVLNTEPSELPTVTFIPENIASLEVGRIDLLRLWKEIPVILSQYDPAAKSQFNIIAGMIRQQTGIDFEHDLLANLGTKYIAFSTDGEKQTSIIAVELNDGTAFKYSLESALSTPAMQPYVASGLEISEFLDHVIYTLKNADPSHAVGIAVTADYLFYGEPEGLRQVLRSISNEAAANMAFEHTELVQGLRKEVPRAAFGFGAIDWKKNMDAVLSELSQPEYRMLIGKNWAISGVDFPPLDFSKLPPADHISSFFNVSYQYIEANNNGLHQKIILKN